jgi:hypothetical protein
MSTIHELPPPFSTLDRHPTTPRIGFSSSLGLPAKIRQPATVEYPHEDQEEGDVLPPYSNNVQLVTICQRKREFNVSCERARKGHRSWETVWMVLEGTALRMYKPTKEEKAEYEQRWGGQQPSASTLTRETPNPTLAHSIRSRSSPLSLIRTSSSLYPTTTVESMPPSTSAGNRSRPPLMGLKHLDDSPGQLLTRPGFANPPSYITSSNLLAPPPNHLTRAQTCYSTPNLVHSSPLSRTVSRLPSIASPSTNTATSTPDFVGRSPIRQYSVRYAVCMKAEAYIKREHVLRFILEDGKQFLVQLSGKTEMVAWLQVRIPLFF